MSVMSVKLLDSIETEQMFGYDEVYQNLKKQQQSTLQCLEISFGGTGSAGFTEFGSAMSAEFNGSAYEKTTVLATTRVLTPGGSYFHFYVIDSSAAITQYYAWFSKYEVFTVKCLSFAATTSGTYFVYYDSEAAPTGYYVWLDKNGDGTTDKPTVATLTEAVCNISGATTADDIATIVAGVINGLAGTGASATTDTVTATMATKGDPTDVADVDTGYTFVVTENGGADPGADGTGAECDIKAATTAANVGTIIQGVIDALSDVTASGTTTVTIINDEIGLVTKTTDGNTGFTITQIEQSSNKYAGAPLYLVSTEANDTDALSGDMRKDIIIGFAKDANGKTLLKSEEVALAGATQVKSTELKWIRAIHHQGSDWGSGGQDAKGAISLEDLPGTDYLDISIGLNNSEGGLIWLPDNMHAQIAEWQLDLHDIAIAAVTDGTVVQAVKSGLDNTKNNRIYNTNPDNPNLSISATLSNPHTKIKWPEKSIMHGSDVGKITFSESLITTTVTFVFKAYVLVWYKSNTEE